MSPCPVMKFSSSQKRGADSFLVTWEVTSEVGESPTTDVTPFFRPERVALPSPVVSQFRREQLIPEPSVVDELERSSYDSVKPFCQGDPGSISPVPAAPLSLQHLSAWARNSGPLSRRQSNGFAKAQGSALSRQRD